MRLDDPVSRSFDKPAVPHLELIILDLSDNENIHVGILQAQLPHPVAARKRKIRRGGLNPGRMEAKISILAHKRPGDVLGNVLVGDEGIGLSPANHPFDARSLGDHPIILEGDKPEIQGRHILFRLDLVRRRLVIESHRRRSAGGKYEQAEKCEQKREFLAGIQWTPPEFDRSKSKSISEKRPMEHSCFPMRH